MTDDEVRRLLAIVEASTETDTTPRQPLWPCHECGARGIRNLGLDGYCPAHLAELYRTFNPAVFVNGGVGLPDGRQQPEYGPCIEELRCVRCDATWSGVAGDPCGWCQRGFEIQRVHQIDLLLTPPDVDPDDQTADTLVDAWLARLMVGIRAGLITERQALAAGRAVARAA